MKKILIGLTLVVVSGVGVGYCDTLRDISDELRAANFRNELRDIQERGQAFRDAFHPPEPVRQAPIEVRVEYEAPRIRVWESQEAYDAAHPVAPPPVGQPIETVNYYQAHPENAPSASEFLDEK